MIIKLVNKHDKHNSARNWKLKPISVVKPTKKLHQLHFCLHSNPRHLLAILSLYPIITIQIHTSCISLLRIELLKSIEIHWNSLNSIEIHWNPLKSIEIHWNLKFTSSHFQASPKETLKSPHWSPLLPAHCSHCWAGPMRHHGNLACVEDMGLLEQSVEHVKPVLEKIMLPM